MKSDELLAVLLPGAISLVYFHKSNSATFVCKRNPIIPDAAVFFKIAAVPAGSINFHGRSCS